MFGVCGRFLDWGNMATSPSPPAPLRLLIVDDHKDSARALSRLLRHEGHTVITAHTVAGALALVVGQLPVDVLISDIGLPGTDGYSLLAAVRELPNDRGAIPAIAVTAYASRADAERALQRGFAAHLAKPYAPSALAAAVREALDRRG